MEIIDCVSFVDYIKLSKEVTDKVGLLTMAFKRLHPHCPADDLVNTGGRIAGIWVKCHKDTGYLMEVIWVTAAKNPNGSHLNYIQAIITKQSADKKSSVPQLKRY
jgi:hypothetical protein